MVVWLGVVVIAVAVVVVGSVSVNIDAALNVSGTGVVRIADIVVVYDGDRGDVGGVFLSEKGEAGISRLKARSARSAFSDMFQTHLRDANNPPACMPHE